MANYGLQALVTAFRSCALPGCPCKHQREPMREKVNKKLDPSHQLDKAAFDAICDDLDQNPIADRPATSGGEKQRDDGNFDRLVKEAFKAFRKKEREITLNAPDGSRVGVDERATVFSGSDNSADNKFWLCAAHLRHYFEFLLVLKGIKPCVLFSKYGPPNDPLFSTVVIDCLVPVMDRLDLWSYGFSLTYQGDCWVFYDTRSPRAPLVKKIFHVHVSEKYLNQDVYPLDTIPGVPESEIAQALGYPVAFDDFHDGHFVHFRDTTELDVLVSRGWTERICCVQAMNFSCPATGDESDWTPITDFYRRCQEAAESVGTDLVLYTRDHPGLTAWLERNPSALDGIDWAPRPVVMPETAARIWNAGGPAAIRLTEIVCELRMQLIGRGIIITDPNVIVTRALEIMFTGGPIVFAPEEQGGDQEGSGGRS